MGLIHHNKQNKHSLYTPISHEESITNNTKLLRRLKPGGVLFNKITPFPITSWVYNMAINYFNEYLSAHKFSELVDILADETPNKVFQFDVPSDYVPLNKMAFFHIQSGSAGSVFIENDILVKIVFDKTTAQTEIDIMEQLYNTVPANIINYFSIPRAIQLDTNITNLIMACNIFEICILAAIEFYIIRTTYNNRDIKISDIKDKLSDSRYIKDQILAMKTSEESRVYARMIMNVYMNIYRNKGLVPGINLLNNYFRLHYIINKYTGTTSKATIIYFNRALGSCNNVFLDKTDSPTLEKTNNRFILSGDHFIWFLIEIIYVLYMTSNSFKHGFLHYDLKLDNILVFPETSTKGKTLTFDNTRLEIPGRKYRFVINDFDLSEIPGIVDNPKLDRLKVTRFSNYIYNDIYFLLKSIKHYRPDIIAQNNEIYTYIIGDNSDGKHEWRLDTVAPFELNSLLNHKAFDAYRK